MAKDEMVGWHHRLDGNEYETPGDGGGQRSLACYSLFDHKDLDTTWATEQQQLLQNLEARL